MEITTIKDIIVSTVIYCDQNATLKQAGGNNSNEDSELSDDDESNEDSVIESVESVARGFVRW